MIENTYGDIVSIHVKNKDLLKFGRNDAIGTTLATVMTLPTGVLHETYVSTNAIDKFSSSSGSDTGTIVVEGHTISGGVFTFVSQEVTLVGQAETPLTTPLARVSRVYNSNSTDWVGVIYVYEDDTVTAGVPQTDSKVHLMTRAGENQSDKCATSISDNDYWLVTKVTGECLEKQASFVELHLEVRHEGKVFRDVVDGSASDGHSWIHDFKPYLIIPKNSDVRLVAVADGAGTQVAGDIEGVLAGVVT